MGGDLPKAVVQLVLMRILLGSAIISTAVATNFAPLTGWCSLRSIACPLHPVPWPCCTLQFRFPFSSCSRFPCVISLRCYIRQTARTRAALSASTMPKMPTAYVPTTSTQASPHAWTACLGATGTWGISKGSNTVALLGYIPASSGSSTARTEGPRATVTAAVLHQRFQTRTSNWETRSASTRPSSQVMRPPNHDDTAGYRGSPSLRKRPFTAVNQSTSN